MIPWGNLLNKTVTKCSAENLSVTALANNQLSGYGYDDAGNMTYDATTGNSYIFDPENRIAQVNGSAASYMYNADGTRARKDVTGQPSTELVATIMRSVLYRFSPETHNIFIRWPPTHQGSGIF